MDDSISGSQTSNDSFDFYLTVKTMMKEGGFNLRKWITNDYDLQQKINNFETDHFGTEQCETNLTDRKVLGVNWETQSDKLVFSLSDIIKEALSYKMYSFLQRFKK